MTQYLDIVSDSPVEATIASLRSSLERAFDAVVATDAETTNTGTLPGADGSSKVCGDLAPEVDTDGVRALLPIITYQVQEQTNGIFSTYDGDQPDLVVFIDCAALDPTSAGELAESVRSRLRYASGWTISGFHVERIRMTSSPRQETRDRWPAIFHVDMILDVNLNQR